MELNEFYKKVGGDYEKVLLRLLAPSMIKKFVCRFVQDPSYAELEKALENKQAADAFRAAHTLKGTAATLGLDQLAQAAADLTEELRNAAEIPEVNSAERVKEAYQMTVGYIAELEA